MDIKFWLWVEGVREQSAQESKLWYDIFIYCNWVSTRWQGSVNLSKNSKEAAEYKWRNNAQNRKQTLWRKRAGVTGGRRQLYDEVNNSLSCIWESDTRKKIGTSDLVHRFSHKAGAVLLFQTVFIYKTSLRTRHGRKWDTDNAVALQYRVISRAHRTLLMSGLTSHAFMWERRK
jgi:hypothetical protein